MARRASDALRADCTAKARCGRGLERRLRLAARDGADALPVGVPDDVPLGRPDGVPRERPDGVPDGYDAAAAVEVDAALVRQVAGRIERLNVDQAQRERADAALALRLQNAELTQGSAVPEEKDDDAAMAARLQRDEAIAYRDARRRLDALTPGETRTPVARPARSRAAVRADIANIYAVHNPEKLDNIDAFLDEAGPGNEEVLLEAIQDKYGVPRSA